MARSSFINTVLRFIRRRGDYAEPKIWSEKAKRFAEKPRERTSPLPITGEVARLLPCILEYLSHYDDGDTTTTVYLAIALVEAIYGLNELPLETHARILSDKGSMNSMDLEITLLLDEYGGLHLVPEKLRGNLDVEARISDEVFLAKGHHAGGMTVRDLFFHMLGGFYTPEEVMFEWTKIRNPKKACCDLIAFLKSANNENHRLQAATGMAQQGRRYQSSSRRTKIRTN